MVFLWVQRTLVEVKVILIHRATYKSFESVLLQCLLFTIPSPSICVIFRSTKTLSWTITRTHILEILGKLWLFLGWIQKQSWEKDLNFIPRIVTAFQGGLGQSYFSRFLQKEENKDGRGIIKHFQKNTFFFLFAMLSTIVPFSWNYCKHTGQISERTFWNPKNRYFHL